MELIIDAGHGGTDPGASGGGWMEKDVTLAYAKLLSLAFEADWGEQGFTTMTREKDMTVSLPDRCEIANHGIVDGWKEAFISLHCNSNEGVPGFGMEVFHHPQSDQGKKLAESIDKHWPFSAKRGVKEAEFYVLKHTRMPAVLLEIGFINNPDERLMMTSIPWALRAVESIIEAINYWRVY